MINKNEPAFTLNLTVPSVEDVYGATHKTEEVQEYLQDLNEMLPLFTHIHRKLNPSEFTSTVTHFQQFKNVLVLGTGGSSLGGKTLYDLCEHPSVSLHFHDNIDPDTFSRFFRDLDLSTTGVLAISKSGGTAETLMQILFCLNRYQDQALPIPHHFAVITELPPHGQGNPLHQLAQFHDIPCLAHPPQIGGRFAVFSAVGLVPAQITGLKSNAVLEGAKSILDAYLTEKTPCPAVTHAGIQVNLSLQGIGQSILFPYVDRLKSFAFWYRQLWAESLGKSGKGTTPVASFGTVDQHSQLQLYLDGPQDKFFTVLTTDYFNDLSLGNRKVSAPLENLSIYDNKSFGDLLMAEQKATLKTLKNRGCPVRHIHLPTIDEYSIGALMMHFILETLAMAKLLNVNPFDQPAVEEGKILTKQYLESHTAFGPHLSV